MKINTLVATAAAFSATAHGFGLQEVSSLEHKPNTLPAQYQYENFHQFENTPFRDWDHFVQTVIKDSSNVTFADINELNERTRPLLGRLTNENFFKIFRLNLYKECPFWSNAEGFCMHKSCAVDTIDDWKNLPDIWQPEVLGRIETISKEPPSTNGSCIATGAKTGKDYCEIDEVNDETVYVNLVDNPERFTGYGGDQSFQIWRSIYNENCFNLGAEQCFEKNFFYRLVSGMHSSINTHLSNEYLNFETKEYEPNLKQFMIRVGDFPDRIENLYMNYILVVKALIKLEQSGVLQELTFCDDGNFQTKEKELKSELHEMVQPFYRLGDSHECLFNENTLFQNDDAGQLKDEFRQRFINVSRVMDCVQCDRCRLWGKLQTTGYGTALKTLFELDRRDRLSTDFQISKIELIALVNTFDRLSKSIASINNFKKLYDAALKQEEDGTVTTAQDFVFTQALDSAVLGETSRSPSDMKFPPPRSGIDLAAAFKQELGNVLDALRFVLSSYRLFPKMVYNWVLIRAVYYWNMFVGHVHEDFDVNRLYRLEL
ncbi:hypothetical protein KL932_003862 [Ogataea haglerorum]|nr:hypothetical protein KL932_003862 [Ogataea haglerorum]KAG7786263.1 hypothetical protein KL945_003489 [Ogataea haglerorum]KAG7786449.1 hypothetical protein KL910_004296 [Ogataea haglerorum]KAG7805975.1 hypothetical protein KL924_004451 [Ogataea haglerorum]